MPLSKRAKLTDAVSVAAPSNPASPILAHDADIDDDDVMPQVGHVPDDMEQELERMMDEADNMDIAE